MSAVLSYELHRVVLPLWMTYLQTVWNILQQFVCFIDIIFLCNFLFCFEKINRVQQNVPVRQMSPKASNSYQIPVVCLGNLMINATFNNMQATSWSSDLFGTAKERNKETGFLK